MTSYVDPVALSEAIGCIYDCAVDPDKWPIALARIVEMRDASVAGFTVTNPLDGQSRSDVSVGLSDKALHDWNSVYGQLLPPALLDVGRMEIDGVYATRDFMDYDEFRQSRFFREWAEPNGFVDSCSSCLMKSPTRFAMATCLLPRLATARDYDLGRLFAPHLRRAVLISDLLDSQRLVVEERANTIDQLRVGVLIADSRCRITYANAAAEAMFAAGDPIRSTGGILSTRTTATTVVLRHAVEQGCREETSLGGSGIGIPALREDGSAAVIHILPLERRTGWRGDRTPSVAVFVATSEHLSSISGGAIAALFNLTTTEAQVLEKIAAGETAKKIAVQMGIAVSTVRTHLLRILDKTGTRRQAELVKLVHELSLPLVTPAGRATSSRTGQQA